MAQDFSRTNSFLYLGKFFICCIMAVEGGVCMFRPLKWYFDWKKNGFERMCDQIADCVKGKHPDYNPIIYAKYFAEQYISKNENGLLRLKAEANNIKHSDFIVNVATITGIGATIFAAIVSTIKDVKISLAVFILISIFILMINMFVSIIKFKNIGVWQKYILVVIEELEKEN